MEITRRDREALDELLGFFDDCKDLTEEHVDAMLVILAEHQQNSVAAFEKQLSSANDRIAALTKERDELREAIEAIRRNSYLDDDVLNRHLYTTVCCAALRNAFALSQPKGGE